MANVSQSVIFLVKRALFDRAKSISNAVKISPEIIDEPIRSFIRRNQINSLILYLDEAGLSLYDSESILEDGIKVDIANGKMGWRMAGDRVWHESIVRACGLKQGKEGQTVFDGTAGLIVDATILARAGATVIVAERSEIVYQLIIDGLHRAELSALTDLTSRISIFHQDSVAIMNDWPAELSKPDVVYLDPMFPNREKSALVKKEMRIFKKLLGNEDVCNDEKLYESARKLALKRVVVKRPKLAPPLADKKPSFSYEGKANRFDVYAQ